MDNDGYAIIEEVFDRSEMDSALGAVSEAATPRTRAGARHLLGIPAIRTLANDARMMQIAAGFVGSLPVPFRATLFDKSPHSNWLVVWHQDTALPLRNRIDDAAWGPWSVKAGILYAHAPAWALESVVALRVHLDDSTAANGPLRVLPGTHVHGVMTDEQIDQAVKRTTSVDCLAPVGGVVAMRPLTVHASSKSTGTNPRRVVHIEYAASVQLAPGVALAVD